MVAKDYDDYVDISDVRFGDTVKFMKGFYKILELTRNKNRLSIILYRTEKTRKYVDLNHKFVRIGANVYEYNDYTFLDDGIIQVFYNFVIELPIYSTRK